MPQINKTSWQRTYPDVHDELTRKTMQAAGCVKRWNGTDHEVIDAALLEVLGEKPDLVVDLGAGEGRLANFLATRFHRVLGIEPDPERFRILRKTAARLSSDGVYIPIHTDINGLSNARAELVLCSHVIQHISPAILGDILHHIASHVLSHNGILLVLTCVANEERFLVVREEDGRSIAERVSPTEFERVTNSNSLGLLPTRHFSINDFSSLFLGAGLRCVFTSVYRTFSFPLRDSPSNLHLSQASDVIGVFARA